MNADFTTEELQFEIEVREFLQNDFPAEYREKVDAGIRLSKDELVHWQKILYKKGWAAPTGRLNMEALAGPQLRSISSRLRWG